MRDPLYAMLERRKNWIKLTFLSWLAFFTAGFAVASLWGASLGNAVQFGASLFVWGGALRTVLIWHATWSVNSVTHVWGYRNYETSDGSRNNPVIGLLAGGEGWHNNHHAAPASARHGHKWWEFDLAWLTIRILMLLGLATNVTLPAANLAVTLKARAAPRMPPT